MRTRMLRSNNLPLSRSPLYAWVNAISGFLLYGMEKQFERVDIAYLWPAYLIWDWIGRVKKSLSRSPERPDQKMSRCRSRYSFFLRWGMGQADLFLAQKVHLLVRKKLNPGFSNQMILLFRSMLRRLKRGKVLTHEIRFFEKKNLQGLTRFLTSK